MSHIGNGGQQLAKIFLQRGTLTDTLVATDVSWLTPPVEVAPRCNPQRISEGGALR